MQTHFEREVADLKANLLLMASHTETAIRLAVAMLLNRDEALLEKVNQNETLIDRFEVQIDEDAIRLLAKAPLASDLRLITMAMKISQNLERMGDEASKIAKRSRELIAQAPLRQVSQIQPLADGALGLLKRALDAFVRLDATAARTVIPDDKQVDALNRQVYNELVRQMTEDSGTVQRGLNLIVVAKSLERIADHSKNIAEETVYLCEARDIRHPAQDSGRSPVA